MSEDRGQRMTTPDTRTLEDVIAAALAECRYFTPTREAAHVAEQVREHLASVLGSDEAIDALEHAVVVYEGTCDSLDETTAEGYARAALAATLGGVR